MKKNIAIGVLIATLLALLIYIFFVPVVRHIAESGGAPLTYADLEAGVECSPLVSSAISNGWNSDSYRRLYAGLVTHRVRTETFTLSLNTEDKTVTKINPRLPEDSYGHETTYLVTTDLIKDRGFRAISENKYEEHLFIEGNRYRHVRMSNMEGNELSIERGQCGVK